MRDKREGMEIDLQKLLLAYLHRWWMVIICAVIAGAAAWYISSNFITPLYKADVTVYVNNIKSGQQVDSISSSNLSTSQRLVNTYINIIESDTVLEKVSEASGLSFTPNQIRSVMSASQVDDTELFKVTITHADPVLAAQLANAVAEVAPSEIEGFVEGSSTKIIDYAKVPNVPASPIISRNCILGALIGCVTALLYITIRFLLDVRIKDEEDLALLFNLPVLAQIPAFAADSGKRRSAYGYHSEEINEEAGK